MTLALEQIDRIVGNQHHNPFEILGPHQVEENGKNVWVVRSYLPNAESVSVMIPATRQEYPMQSVHHDHFFSCTIDLPELHGRAHAVSLALRRFECSHFWDQNRRKGTLVRSVGKGDRSVGALHDRLHEGKPEPASTGGPGP